MPQSYAAWLAAFRRAAFALRPQASSLAMPSHSLTLTYYNGGVSPYCAALEFFPDLLQVRAA